MPELKLSIIISLAVVAIFAAAIVCMNVRFHRNLKKTLYLYSNIELAAAIIYLGIFAVLLVTDTVKGLLISGSTDPAHIADMFIQFPRVFTHFALFGFGIVSILLFISNIALIKHEGFRPKNALGIALGVLIIGGTAGIHALADAGFGRYMLFFLVMICYFECILAGTAVLGYLAARQKPKYDKDFIIIPGCAISKSGGLLPLLKGRANRAVRYAWDQEIACGKPVHYVPSGGQGPDEVMSEGSAMELYLLSHGAEDYEVFPEKKSMNTLENFKFSKEIIDSIDPDGKIAFATTNYHMLRCGLLAYSLGMDAEGIASDTKWYFWPNGFVREFIAILSMHKKSHLIFAAAALIVCVFIAVLF